MVQFPYDYIVKRNLVVWEPVGLVVWWSGLHRSAAKRRVAEKFCVAKILYRKNVVSLTRKLLGSTLGNNFLRKQIFYVNLFT